MKKGLLILASASILSANAHSQAVQHAVVEEFTGAWCGWCPDGAVILEEIVTTHANAIGISIHDGDAMITTDGNLVDAFYNTLGYPSGIVNRSAASMSRSLWETSAVNAMSEDPIVSVSFTSWTYDAASGSLSLTVQAEFVAHDTGVHRLNVGLIEDDVTGTGSGYNQVNYLNTTPGHPYYGAGDPIIGFSHNHVLRDYLSGAWGGAGVIPDTVYPGLTVSYTYTTTLSPLWDETMMTAVGTVNRYDGSGKSDRKIMNAGELPFSVILASEPPAATDESIFSIVAYPNPVQNESDIAVYMNKTEKITAEVIAVDGRHIATLAEGVVTSGQHNFRWLPGDAANGLYMIVVRTESGQMKTARVLLAR